MGDLTPCSPEIHAVVMEVARLAEQHGGDYDGWGCSVVSVNEVSV